MVLLLIISVLLMALLLLLFKNTTLQNKRILFIPINSLAVLLWYIIYKTRENHILNIHLKIFCRVFKFVVVFIIFYCIKQVVYIDYTSVIYASIALVVVLDFLRAYIYELSKERILNRLLTGMFRDILKFEIILRFKNAKKHLRSSLINSLEIFHSMGHPKKLDADECFAKWNNRPAGYKRHDRAASDNSEEEEELASSLGRESVRDTFTYNHLMIRRGGRNVANKDMLEEIAASEKLDVDLDSLVPPDSYLFKEYTEDEEPEKMPVDPPDDTIDSDEATPLDQFVPADFCMKQFDENQFQWLYLEKYRLHVEEFNHGKITVESLCTHFPPNRAKLIYKVLTFQRSEALIKSILRENIRQINNERENLYVAAGCSLRLLSIIYWTLIFIEGLFVYTTVSTYLQIQPLLVKLMLPIFIVPILPSLKSILEAFFFIVFSHPYDPGDRVHLDGENYIVRDINMMSTTLIRWDGMKCLIPNNEIKDKVLINIRRSWCQNWRIEFLIDAVTTDNRINLLNTLLEKYIKLDRAYKSITCNVSEIVDCAFIKLSIIVEHSSNFQNGFLMWNNHSKFIRIVNKSLYVLKIRYLPLSRKFLYKGNDSENENYIIDNENYQAYEDYILTNSNI
ncbi:Mechanosensitive ion channel protein 8 [Nosema granulosis]|uniref:Mechanosensitive ion channel protein 8 n=1 Tax=Nosema granulosis TaxID=83296 RepID=A0A9P6KYD1_9MICR|nr:Mechanosensitive ion channel protein 8 [Nosema granulosis]